MPWNAHIAEAEWVTLEDEKLDGLIRQCQDQKIIGIDTETTGLVTWKDMPLFWSLSFEERRICMPASTLAAFRNVFEDPSRDWILANAKYDAHILANAGSNLKGRLIDVQVMHAMLYGEESHALKDMEQSVLGWRRAGFKDTFKQKAVGEDVDEDVMQHHVGYDILMKAKLAELGAHPKETIGQVLLRTQRENLPKLVEYASSDAYYAVKLYDNLKLQLERAHVHSLYPDKYATLADIFFKTEVPFTRVLFNCERKGILLDVDHLKKIEEPIRRDMASIEKKIVSLAGRLINPRSAPQLREYFLKERKLTPLTMTKGGKTGVRLPSVDKGFLEHYSDTEPMAALILEHRELGLLISNYVEGLQERMDPWGRVHTRYNQDVARTGRLSSSDPNLQNIKRSEDDKYEIRKAFIAPSGRKLIVADYEQLEMRLLASAAMEPKMIDIFHQNRDIHMGNAEMVFGTKYGITYEDIVAAKKIDKKVKNGEFSTSAYTQKVKDCLYARQAVKEIGFGLNYGMKEKLLAKKIGCTVPEAVQLMNAYLGAYPAVTAFYDEAIRETEDTLYAFTLIGRRRFLPEIMSSRKDEQYQAQRQAGNTQIQGTAADVCRFGMLNCFYSGLEERFNCNMLMQVHDELIFEVPEETVGDAMDVIRDCMEHPFDTDLSVALTCSIGHGDNWMDAK